MTPEEPRTTRGRRHPARNGEKGPVRWTGPFSSAVAEGSEPSVTCALCSSCRPLDSWGRWGQEGLTAETGVAVTLLSHSAHHPSFRATWCFPERGSPMTIVGYATGSLPDTQ